LPKETATVSGNLPAHAADPEKPAGDQPLQPGAQIGNYTILRLIGQGGMGAVYQAEHRLMRRKVALKLITAATLQNPDALQRFHREALAVARLEHPNIVTAHDADQVGDLHFLVMQYVDGDDLATTVRKYGPLSTETAMRCLMQAARGLEYAHQEGVVHRDIKPSNLMVARNGVVKILDMGLARLEQSLVETSSMDRNLTQAGNIMGTIDYMAPEQALDAKDADQRADIYSLGCTFYYLLTGRKMYSGDTTMKRILAHRINPNPKLRAAREDVPVWLESVFQKMIAKDVADRYQSMTEVLSALEPYVASGLSNPETDVSVPGRRSLSEEASSPRPAAALLVDVPHAERAPSKFVAEQTTPNSDSDTQIKAIAPRKPVAAAQAPAVQSPSAQAPPARSDASGTTAPKANWRARSSAVGRVAQKAITRKRRHRLLAVAAFYLGLVVALGAFIYVWTDGYQRADGGTFVIEAADEDVVVALHDQGIRVHEAKTGRVFTLQAGRHDLKTGDYEIDVSELPLGIEINKTRFRLKRGGSERLAVTLAKKED
jgi:serine/threonine protein kinase